MSERSRRQQRRTSAADTPQSVVGLWNRFTDESQRSQHVDLPLITTESIFVGAGEPESFESDFLRGLLPLGGRFEIPQEFILAPFEKAGFIL